MTQLTRSSLEGGLEGCKPSKNLSFSLVRGDFVAPRQREREILGAASRPPGPTSAISETQNREHHAAVRPELVEATPCAPSQEAGKASFEAWLRPWGMRKGEIMYNEDQSQSG